MPDRWITAQFDSKCSGCECDIIRGEVAYYCPNEDRRADVYCRICARDIVPDEMEVRVEVD